MTIDESICKYTYVRRNLIIAYRVGTYNGNAQGSYSGMRGSNRGEYIGYPDWGLSWLYSVIPGKWKEDT
jgi:hypothetical protein